MKKLISSYIKKFAESILNAYTEPTTPSGQIDVSLKNIDRLLLDFKGKKKSIFPLKEGKVSSLFRTGLELSAKLKELVGGTALKKMDDVESLKALTEDIREDLKKAETRIDSFKDKADLIREIYELAFKKFTPQTTGYLRSTNVEEVEEKEKEPAIV